MKEETKAPETTANLTPPWYTVRNEIAALLTSVHVKVAQLQGDGPRYEVPITVNDNDIAVAIASILPDRYSLGNITVIPKVTFNNVTVKPIVPTTPQQLDKLIRTAFRDNKLLADVVVAGTVYPIFAAQDVQFFNDDLTDAFGNFNALVATCARNVLAPKPGGILLSPSTVKIATALPIEPHKLAEARV